MKTLREKQGLTRAALARRIGVSGPYISMIESGTRKAQSLPMLKKFAKALRVPLATLLE